MSNEIVKYNRVRAAVVSMTKTLTIMMLIFTAGVAFSLYIQLEDSQYELARTQLAQVQLEEKVKSLTYEVSQKTLENNKLETKVNYLESQTLLQRIGEETSAMFSKTRQYVMSFF